MTDELQGQILDAIFSSIIDPVAIFRVIGGGDEPVDIVYERVNDAYCRMNHLTREDVIGRKYTQTFPDEEYKGWEELLLRVASTDSSAYNDTTQSYSNSGYYEGPSSVTPGYYHVFAFSPIKGHVVSIARNLSDLHQLAIDLREKEKLLLASREDLRRLTTSLTLAEEKTRRSIATTLHDTLGYSMVSLLHGMKTLQSMADGARNDKLSELITETEKLIDDTRAFTFSISPPLLYELGLDAALASRCDTVRRTYNLDCRFESAGGERELPEDTKILLYQTAHELLVNVTKHAHAKSVTVQTRWGSRKVQLFVEDDGVGFDPEAKKGRGSSGMGLFSIKERLETIGGKFDVISTPGHGTIASVVAPINYR